MCSAPDAGDLNARARIRNAAITLFGARGFERASLRAIAEAAGVSPSLVVHHFKDKVSLRAACDQHVVRLFVEDEHGLVDSPTIEGIQAALNDLDTYGPALDYLTRMLTEDSAAADDLFDALLRGTRQILDTQQAAGLARPSSDPAAMTLLLTIFGLAPLILKRQFTRALGEPGLTKRSLERITIPTLELLTRGLYRDDALAQAAGDTLGRPEDGQQPPTG